MTKTSLSDNAVTQQSNIFKNFLNKQLDLQNLMFAIQISFFLMTTSKNVDSLLQYGLSAFSEEELQEIHENQREGFLKFLNSATKQRLLGHPFLYSQILILLYTFLEATIRDVIKVYIKEDLQYNNTSILKLFKYNEVDLIDLDEDQKIDYLYRRYETQRANGLKYGFKRFEHLLIPIGLSGSACEKTINSISELAQVRNILLHKAGIVDQQLIQQCPHLKIKFGDQLIVSRDMFIKYDNAIINYVLTIELRSIKNHGVEVSEDLNKLLNC